MSFLSSVASVGFRAVPGIASRLSCCSQKKTQGKLENKSLLDVQYRTKTKKEVLDTFFFSQVFKEDFHIIKNIPRPSTSQTKNKSQHALLPPSALQLFSPVCPIRCSVQPPNFLLMLLRGRNGITVTQTLLEHKTLDLHETMRGT
ncbi:unnamed protein product [Lota lota]